MKDQRLLRCDRCSTPVISALFNSDDLMACPGCGSLIRVFAFPALLVPREISLATDRVSDGDAICFYHEDREVDTSCDRCGRFLCSLCAITVGQADLCPDCISGESKSSIKELKQRNVRFDSMALALAVLPILMWPVTVITAPIALYLAVTKFKHPCSIIQTSRIRFILAGLISTTQVVGWMVLAYVLISRALF